MTIDDAFKRFKETTGSGNVDSNAFLSRETFASVFRELTDRKPLGDGFADEDALALLCEWYEGAEVLRERGPLFVVETFRRPRAWVTFLAWRDREVPS